MTSPKPTDSEQLDAWMISLGFRKEGDPHLWWHDIEHDVITQEQAAFFYQAMQRRDQQRWSSVLEAIASKMRSTNCVYVNGVNDCLEALTEALGLKQQCPKCRGKAFWGGTSPTTPIIRCDMCDGTGEVALGPDNSSVEEKHDVPQ